MAIQQDDISAGAISATRSSNFAITQTVAYAQSNLTKSLYSIGTVAGMVTSDPIAIKDFGVSSVSGWADEQDWTIYNQSFTVSIPVNSVVSGTSSYETLSTNANISIGDLVGIYGPGAWSTGNNATVARGSGAGLGSQNAGLMTGGTTTSGQRTDSTELFNGSTWATSSNLIISRASHIGVGSFGAAMVAGGSTSGGNSNTTELFNGATWTASGAMIVTKTQPAGMGSQNAAVLAGGSNFSFTELFNGATWTASGNLSSEKQTSAGAGSQNAGLNVGGVTGAGNTIALTELFNGSAWAASGYLLTAKGDVNALGSQTAAMMAGGSTTTAYSRASELFNGSSWCANSPLNAIRGLGQTGGSQSAGFIMGGYNGTSFLNSTELHNQTLFRKIVNSRDLRCATNVGVAFNVSSLTLSVKINGYIDNINVTSSNANITTELQWVDKWVALPRFAPNAATTNNPPSVVVKSVVEPEDFVVGYAISKTQMQVFTGILFAKDRIGGW